MAIRVTDPLVKKNTKNALFGNLINQPFYEPLALVVSGHILTSKLKNECKEKITEKKLQLMVFQSIGH